MEPTIVEDLHKAAREKPLGRKAAGMLHEAADLIELLLKTYPEAAALVPLKYQRMPGNGFEP